jgi:N-dimethylarginine dimethylaminohydrolase
MTITRTVIRETPVARETLLRPLAPAALAFNNTSPGTLEKPAFVMNCPFSYHTETPNNPWMQDISGEERKVDRGKAFSQFSRLYHHLASDGIVFLLPTPRNCRLQDLVFTANLGVVLEHIAERNVVVLSNFRSEPRVGEAEVGEAFFTAMGFAVVRAPYQFEGEAELKHLHGGVYIGGYGIRSDRRVYEWMENEFDMQVIKLEEVDPYLYHLDCSIFPLTPENTIVCTELFSKTDVARIEQHTNVIDVSADDSYSGICNSVRYHNSILNSSHIHSLKPGSDDYWYEVKKNRKLEDIAVRHGLEVSYFNLSEYHKSGALLSCMVMHLNRRSYNYSLI